MLALLERELRGMAG